MMTVLHTESSKGWGGQEQRTLRESLGLKKLGVRVVILCPPDAELGRRAGAAGIEVRHAPMRKSFDFPAVLAILRVIREVEADVVNTHSGRDSFLAGIAGRLSRRKPVVVRTRHLALPITSKISYSVLPHRVVTVSDYVRSYLLGEGVPSQQVVSIPTGIDVERFNPGRSEATLRGELGIPGDVPLIGTVAILRRRKGHHILMEAIPRVLREFPQARFVFAGNGPQEETIQSSIGEQGLTGSVTMLGLRNDIPNVLNSLDLFVLPTLQEALGTSFLEAMAMEKPVIGSNVDGVGEVIRDGVNGFLVEAGNSEKLADAIIAMLADRERMRAMGLAGKEMVMRDFTVERMCERMLGLYSGLLADKKP
ncbi:MAG: glycosyltransferase family 1 protein [Desulfuromonadales bacterium]|nr:MAG: glycosyltransferase family 1 protein [Desulfuromonadales bacterium]